MVFRLGCARGQASLAARPTVGPAATYSPPVRPAVGCHAADAMGFSAPGNQQAATKRTKEVEESKVIAPNTSAQTFELGASEAHTLLQEARGLLRSLSLDIKLVEKEMTSVPANGSQWLALSSELRGFQEEHRLLQDGIRAVESETGIAPEPRVYKNVTLYLPDEHEEEYKTIVKDATFEELVDLLLDSGYSQVVVVDEKPDKCLTVDEHPYCSEVAYVDLHDNSQLAVVLFQPLTFDYRMKRLQERIDALNDGW